MKVYSTDIKLYATAYIVADSEEEALEIAKSLANTTLDLPEGYAGDSIEIWGGSFHNEMPELTLSPAMTIAALEEQDLSLDLSEEIDDDPEDGDTPSECGQCEGTGKTQSASNLETEECPVCDGNGEIG